MRRTPYSAALLSLAAVAFTALSVFFGNTALAEDGYGALNGNDVNAPVRAPIQANCQGVGVLGDANTQCQAGYSSPKPSPSASPSPASSPSPMPSAVSPTRPTLPVTGVSAGITVTTALALIGAGYVLTVVARRRGRHAAR